MVSFNENAYSNGVFNKHCLFTPLLLKSSLKNIFAVKFGEVSDYFKAWNTLPTFKCVNNLLIELAAPTQMNGIKRSVIRSQKRSLHILTSKNFCRRTWSHNTIHISPNSLRKQHRLVAIVAKVSVKTLNSVCIFSPFSFSMSSVFHLGFRSFGSNHQPIFQPFCRRFQLGVLANYSTVNRQQNELDHKNRSK